MFPLLQDYDCSRLQVYGAKVPCGQVYATSEPELAALPAYIWENLSKGFIMCSFLFC